MLWGNFNRELLADEADLDEGNNKALVQGELQRAYKHAAWQAMFHKDGFAPDADVKKGDKDYNGNMENALASGWHPGQPAPYYYAMRVYAEACKRYHWLRPHPPLSDGFLPDFRIFVQWPLASQGSKSLSLLGHAAQREPEGPDRPRACSPAESEGVRCQRRVDDPVCGRKQMDPTKAQRHGWYGTYLTRNKDNQSPW